MDQVEEKREPLLAVFERVFTSDVIVESHKFYHPGYEWKCLVFLCYRNFIKHINDPTVEFERFLVNFVATVLDGRQTYFLQTDYSNLTNKEYFDLFENFKEKYGIDYNNKADGRVISELSQDIRKLYHKYSQMNEEELKERMGRYKKWGYFKQDEI